jgi:hypothetical protein
MTAPDGTRAYERLRAAREAKEHDRDAMASVEGVEQLSRGDQDEWDELNHEVSNLRVAEESVRANTHVDPG